MLQKRRGEPGETSGEYWLRTEWVKRRYFIQDGLIRPVIGSDPEKYNPFNHYFHRGHAKTGRSLYLELCRLDLDSEAAIEGFVSKWGLLGLFQDRLLQARYVEENGEVLVEAPDEWVVSSQPDLQAEGEIRPSGSAVIVEVMHDLSSTAFEEHPLLWHYARYFPHIEYTPTTGCPLSLPPLHSDALFDHLCEPVAQFRAEVHRLRFLVEHQHEAIRSHTLQSLPKPADTNPTFYGVFTAETVNQRIRRVRRALVGDGAEWQSRWVFPSLLSALYAMFFEDLTRGGLRVCANERCANPFAPSRSDQTFCSKACGDATKKRRKYAAQRSKP